MAELPQHVIDEAERLTRLARDAVDEGEARAYRRERTRLLEEHGYTDRIRAEDVRDVLVLHPDEWVEDGTIRVERIEDTDRGVEIPLDGPGDPDDWDAIDEHNREIARTVRDEYGDVHGDNATAFADFMSNHYARRVESASRAEIEEFLSEYFPRNAWPSERQKVRIERSLSLVFEVADGAYPLDG